MCLKISWLITCMPLKANSCRFSLTSFIFSSLVCLLRQPQSCWCSSHKNTLLLCLLVIASVASAVLDWCAAIIAVKSKLVSMSTFITTKSFAPANKCCAFQSPPPVSNTSLLSSLITILLPQPLFCAIASCIWLAK